MKKGATPLTKGPLADPALIATALLAAALVTGCKEDAPPKREPPPPASVAKPAACATGGGVIGDADVSKLVPRVIGDFCIDPNDSEKTFGEAAKAPLDKICDLFDGECEIYKGFNLRRLVALRYVNGAGKAATIDMYVEKYASAESAYGMFTKRVVGEGDPAREDTPKPIEGGGSAALGKGSAQLWRGSYLVELTYADEAANAEAIDAACAKLLPALVKEIGAKIPGDTALPAAALALPKEHRLPLGIRWATKDVLGIEPLAPAAFGYYADGARRYRMLAAQREPDAAKDLLATIAKQPGATKEKGPGDGQVRLVRKEGAVSVEWIFTRKGNVILGVGDEPLALRPGMPPEQATKLTLSHDEKLKAL
jgi:hypothetical protein